MISCNIFEPFQIQATIPATTPLDPPPPPDPSEPNLTPLPVPPPAIQLTPLLGHGPSENMQTLHALYASQIATLVWIAEAEEALEAERRGVVVGLALRKSEATTGSTLSEHERRVFHGVMEIVRELLQSTTTHSHSFSTSALIAVRTSVSFGLVSRFSRSLFHFASFHCTSSESLSSRCMPERGLFS